MLSRSASQPVIAAQSVSGVAKALLVPHTTRAIQQYGIVCESRFVRWRDVCLQCVSVRFQAAEQGFHVLGSHRVAMNTKKMWNTNLCSERHVYGASRACSWAVPERYIEVHHSTHMPQAAAESDEASHGDMFVKLPTDDRNMVTPPPQLREILF
eukprot:5577468-Amphidinium_carterae.1